MSKEPKNPRCPHCNKLVFVIGLSTKIGNDSYCWGAESNCKRRDHLRILCEGCQKVVRHEQNALCFTCHRNVCKACAKKCIANNGGGYFNEEGCKWKMRDLDTSTTARGAQ